MSDRDRLLPRSSDERRRQAQRSVKVRLEQIRDDIDKLLAGRGEVTVDDLQAVVFGVSDGETAQGRVTQEPGDTPPPAAYTIIGEMIDGFSEVTGRTRVETAGYIVEIMRESTAAEDYGRDLEATVEGSR